MTEEEAKTKWCPHVRSIDTQIGPDDGGPCNSHMEGEDLKDGRNPIYARCIGSACMAWRFVDEVINLPTSPGYCGLAGKP